MSGSSLAAVAEAAAQAPAAAAAPTGAAAPAAPAAQAAPAPAAAAPPAAAQPAAAASTMVAHAGVTAAAALDLLVVGYPDLKALVEPLAAKAQAGCTEAEFSRAILEAKAGGVTAPVIDTRQGNGMAKPAAAEGAAGASASERPVIDTAGIYGARAQAQTPQA